MKIPFTNKKIKLSKSEKLIIIESLSITLSAGIPILEGLESIAEDTSNKTVSTIASGLSQEISNGKSLSDALNCYPELFDTVIINVTKAGEASGNLDKVLNHLAENLKADIEAEDNIKSALFYPALVVGALILVAFYAFGYAIPQVANTFLGMQMQLPVYSMIILKSSLFFQKYKLFFVAIFILGAILTIQLSKINKVRTLFFGILIKISVFQTMVRFLDLARFTNTSSILLRAGVPIIEVLEITKNVVVSPKLSSDIEIIKQTLTQGSTLTEGMKKQPKSFPSLLRRIVKTGEETGTLDTSLANISNYYQDKFTYIIKNLTILLEPILIVFISVLVGAVLISIIVPIYQGIGQLTPRQGL